MIIILDNIRSSHNVGSIFRTADGVGTIEKIYLSGITATPLDRFGQINQKLTKVSLGAEKFVLWEKISRGIDLIKRLKKEDFTIVSLEQHKSSLDYKKFPHAYQQAGKVDFKKMVLILGSETKGIRETILKISDYILEIPMRGKKESLNVAVAFGIVAYSFNEK